jgi:hypothetical protein
MARECSFINEGTNISIALGTYYVSHSPHSTNSKPVHRRKGKDYTYLYGKHVGAGSLTPFIDQAFDPRIDE